MGHEVSNSDGTVTMYTELTGDHTIDIKIDKEQTASSIVYNNQTERGNASAINIASVGSNVSLGTISLADGGVLRTLVYDGNNGDTSTPIGAFSVEVRDGADAANATRFMRTGTRGDGSAVLSLPPATYPRIKMRDASSGGNCDYVTITAGQTTTLHYYNGDNTCAVQ